MSDTYYLLINYSGPIETNEFFYNRKRNFWKRTKDIKTLEPIEEYLISQEQTREPIVALNEEGKDVELYTTAFIPVPF